VAIDTLVFLANHQFYNIGGIHLKKLISIMLIAGLVLSTTIPASALTSAVDSLKQSAIGTSTVVGAATNTIVAASSTLTVVSTTLPLEIKTVTIGGIEAILVSGSTDMALAKNNLDQTDQDYRNQKSDLSALQKQYDAIDLTAAGGWSQAASLSSQLTTMRSSLTTSKYNLDAAKLRYDQQVRQAVLAAQQQFISASTAMAQSTISENNLISQEKQLSSMKLKLEKGFVSKKQYDAFVTQVTDLKKALVDLQNQSVLGLDKLRVTLGLKEGTLIKLVPETTFDFSQIPALDRVKDLQTMLDSSINIQTKRLSLESINKAKAASYDPSSFKYSILDAELLLKQTIDQEKLDFQDQFTSLQSSYAALNIQTTKLADKRAQLKTMELLQSYGFASKKQVDDLKTEVTNQELQIILDQHNLYLLENQYNAAKLGY
jgi:hypothetical protein